MANTGHVIARAVEIAAVTAGGFVGFASVAGTPAGATTQNDVDTYEYDGSTLCAGGGGLNDWCAVAAWEGSGYITGHVEESTGYQGTGTLLANSPDQYGGIWRTAAVPTPLNEPMCSTFWKLNNGSYVDASSTCSQIGP